MRAFALVIGVALVATGCTSRLVSYGTLNREPLVELLEETVRIRGLAPREPVVFRVVRIETYRTDGAPRRGVLRESEHNELLRRLGIIRGTDTLGGAHRRMLTSGGLFGYYASKDRSVWIVDSGLRSDLLEIVSAVRGRDPIAEGMVHEITHALQDQHFAIDRAREGLVTTDEKLAFTALVEGDATLTAALYDDFLAPETKAGLYELLSGQTGERDAENFQRELSQFVYAEGVRFVRRLHRSDGFTGIDWAYKAPPRTTYEIIHPDVYSGGFVASDLAGSAPAEGVVFSDTLGALVLGMFVSDLEGPATARSVIRDWRGDRAWVVRNEQGSSAGWAVAMASDAAAARLAALGARRCTTKAEANVALITCRGEAQ